jgi:hypothetical protein
MLNPQDHNLHFQFRIDFQQQLEEDGFAGKLDFSDEAKFHVCGKENHHRVYIWGTESPHATVAHIHDSPEYVFCRVLLQSLQTILLCRANRYWYKLPGPAATVANATLHEDSKDFIFQQDGALPHFNFDARVHLIANLPVRWIGHASDNDSPLLP